MRAKRNPPRANGNAAPLPETLEVLAGPGRPSTTAYSLGGLRIVGVQPHAALGPCALPSRRSRDGGTAPRHGRSVGRFPDPVSRSSLALSFLHDPGSQGPATPPLESRFCARKTQDGVQDWMEPRIRCGPPEGESCRTRVGTELGCRADENCNMHDAVEILGFNAGPPEIAPPFPCLSSAQP